jgi:glycosyltransferase involved in cell wall biosynthesis
MRLLLCTTDLALGGAEAQVAQLAARLRARDWDVAVLSLKRPSAWEAELAQARVPVYSLGLEAGPPGLRSLWRLAAIMRQVRPHILHAHLFHANVLTRLLRLAFPVPVVISTIHSMAESSRGSDNVRGRDRLYRLTDRLSDATVAVCEAAAGRHRKAGAVSASRLKVIPNGVDTSRFRPDRGAPARERFTWLAAGRLMWKKDYATMLRALAGLPGATLLIAGDGPQRAELEKLAADLNVDARFLGARGDIADLMNGCDAFVLSSRVEGLPLVLLEASACGLPCAATNAGGVEEIVLDGRTGFLAPPADPDALQTAMRKIMSMSPEERRRMGHSAREHAVANFDWDAVLPRWQSLYTALLDSARVFDREPRP